MRFEALLGGFGIGEAVGEHERVVEPGRGSTGKFIPQGQPDVVMAHERHGLGLERTGKKMAPSQQEVPGRQIDPPQAACVEEAPAVLEVEAIGFASGKKMHVERPKKLGSQEVAGVVHLGLLILGRFTRAWRVAYPPPVPHQLPNPLLEALRIVVRFSLAGGLLEFVELASLGRRCHSLAPAWRRGAGAENPASGWSLIHCMKQS